MSRLGLKSNVFHGDFYLGAVEVEILSPNSFQFPNNEIRISHISLQSERCPPLSILQTIAPSAVRCKLRAESSAASDTHLGTLYKTCLMEHKTAVVMLGGEELHLVAMKSKHDPMLPCFWCYSVRIGLYGSCLGLLNLRCLSIVFDLDETLIVANTMKSFEDRIEFLQRRLECEEDPVRVSGMSAELRRYVEDRTLLKQFVESDNVIDNGRHFGVQFEVVQSPTNELEKIVRPVVRLKDKNIVLTRINPEIRDTSVLVRLRPAWEDLRSYLNAKGRKRFEVYVCTMAERDYALEMWRLLDPEALLISSNQLSNRIVCVKSGARKSLSSVFQDGTCHPRMAMVIDDRQKVWVDSDQPRVHVVPAFTPYYAPQAETASVVPVLCVARNVACNVRAGYFKEFDENLIGKIMELSYEDEVTKLPDISDVSDFLGSEDTLFVPNGNRDVPISEVMNGNEAERRLNKVDETHAMYLAPPNIPRIPDPGPEASQHHVSVSSNVVNTETSRTDLHLHKFALPESSFSPNIEVSDLDPDKKRRLSVMHHGQDIREHNSSDPLPLSRISTDVTPQPIKSFGGWLVEEDSNIDQINSRAAGPAQGNDASQDKQQATQNHPSHVSQLKSNEAYSRQEGTKQNHSQSNHSLTIGEMGSDQANREVGVEAGAVSPRPPYVYIGVLQEIGRRCCSKIEYRSVVSTSKDLQFSVEVLFGGDQIGVGMGKTKKDAQQQAAENALRTLSDEYKSYIRNHSGPPNGDAQDPSHKNENGFIWDDSGPDERPLEEPMHIDRTFEAGGMANGGLKSFGTQEAQPRANSPRPSESFQNKRLRVDTGPDLQITSAENHKNGSTVS